MSKRNPFIDTLRGVSLLGILLANMLIFQYGMWGKDALEHFPQFASNDVAHIWLKIFVEGSFMPIFMFLFGYSMIKLKDKLEATGGKVKRVFFRRFVLMLSLGLLHAFYLFEGDILTTYGGIGILLLVFINRKPKTLWIWAVTLFILSSLASYGPNVLEDPSIARNIDEYVPKAIHVYKEGTFSEISEFRMSPEDPLGLTDIQYVVIFLLAPFAVFPMFLLGMIAAKKSWFSELVRERVVYARVAWLLVPGGLLLKSLPHIFPSWDWSGVAGTLGASLLAIGYIFTVAFVYGAGERPIFRLFEKVGKLSMTNYLMQSVVCSLIFYGYGVGLYGQIGVLNGIFLALVIYAGQVVFSHWYLSRWKLGPFEWLIRFGTYMNWRGARKAKHISEGQVSVMG